MANCDAKHQLLGMFKILILVLAPVPQISFLFSAFSALVFFFRRFPLTSTFVLIGRKRSRVERDDALQLHSTEW